MSNQDRPRNLSKPEDESKSTKIKLLRKYIATSDYIEVEEQPTICESFGLHYVKSAFQEEYRKRFFGQCFNKPVTVGTVNRLTGIPDKFLTYCKQYYEKRGLLKVVGVGRCPSSLRVGVQFVSTNPQFWGGLSGSEDDQQLCLF
jgi:hypothetical protein